ncbi:MAG TPA: glycosyltransferase [Burkholderiales bacterium]|nr:glycosyltransferase [Burkholderiales bacterium]
MSAKPLRPLVSVVIPAYNCADFIGDALDSVLDQGYPALEIIVVDDGSTDATCDVVARRGSGVTLVRQANAGAAAARNIAIARSRGQYLAFLDADDLWLPGKLRLQVDHLESHADVGLCCTRWNLLRPDEDGRYRIERAAAPESVAVDAKFAGWVYCELLLDCEVWTSTVLMRRELAGRIGGFDVKLRRGQDYDYWLRASRATRIDRLDAPLALYRMQVEHDRKFPDVNWELKVIRHALEQWGAAGPDGSALSDAQVRARLWELNYRFGYLQYRGGRYALAKSAFAAALRERPTHVKTLLYALASKLGQLGAPAGTAGRSTGA